MRPQKKEADSLYRISHLSVSAPRIAASAQTYSNFTPNGAATDSGCDARHRLTSPARIRLQTFVTRSQPATSNRPARSYDGLVVQL
ncbi:hypothetical protein BDI4_1280025 [Burkholderia diffusa]|nr:hypothetical protein BDI4_1280025 [Burkholderia diffusa]